MARNLLISLFFGLSLICLGALGAPYARAQVAGECASPGGTGGVVLDPSNVGRRQGPAQRKPPTPNVTYPNSGIVIDANSGLFIATNGQRVATWFSWKRGGPLPPVAMENIRSTPPRTINNPMGNSKRTVGDTTHYEICVYEPNRAGECDRAVGNNARRNAFVQEQACNNTQVVINLGAFPYSDRQVLSELEWKMRACNRFRPSDRCSTWSKVRKLRWLPPPDLMQNSQVRAIDSWNSPNTSIQAKPIHDTNSDEVSYLFCLAKSGTACPPQERYGPNTDPWVRLAPFVSGRDPGIRLEQQAANGDVAWYVGQTVNWSAASCLDLLGGGRGCVYQQNIRTLVLPPQQ